ncbi:hypothetical protein A5630_13985 [Mycolicibacterium mucogenicum]|uniref:Uncharacterized protein n=1 Tax=Mycolicibacterium mucogenicum TaxID=56689 RepID=A0A1A3HCP0_MYCMU|nr:hypothetical protein [Mycolicibacterium mucogenicum]OBJ45439.1 hypothetical protein A5630_13985 [Mycolicibacterium mucogenicum]
MKAIEMHGGNVRPVQWQMQMFRDYASVAWLPGRAPNRSNPRKRPRLSLAGVLRQQPRLRLRESDYVGTPSDDGSIEHFLMIHTGRVIPESLCHLGGL